MSVIILQGIPGSGKTSYRSKLAEHYSVSADDYRMVNGKYVFDALNPGTAHAKCIRRFVDLVQSVPDFDIVVDNTNTSIEEIAPYYALAEAYGYDAKIVRIVCDPETAYTLGTHGVPRDRVFQMHMNITGMNLPARWKLEIYDRNSRL